jgi:GntR family transcriptional regulator
MGETKTVAETLRRRIVQQIDSGELPEGHRLGSERELSEQYSVSRNTLRQVLSSLEEAGLVRRVTGRAGGTFVAHPKVSRDMAGIVGVPAYLAKQGYTAGTQVLSTHMAVADEVTRRALHLTEGDLVVNLRRIRFADRRPISLEFAQLPVERFPGLMEQRLGSSIYELLEHEYGVAAADAEEQVEVVLATDEEAGLLGVEPGAPLLAVSRVTYDAEEVPIERSYDLFRADRTRIVMRTNGRGLAAVPMDDASVLHLTNT